MGKGGHKIDEDALLLLLPKEEREEAPVEATNTEGTIRKVMVLHAIIILLHA